MGTGSRTDGERMGDWKLLFMPGVAIWASRLKKAGNTQGRSETSCPGCLQIRYSSSPRLVVGIPQGHALFGDYILVLARKWC